MAQIELNVLEKYAFADIFEDRYRVYVNGSIYSFLSNRKIKTKVTRYGYEYICLYPKKGQQKYFFVHRIVAQAFLGELPRSLQCNHKDGNKLNNHLGNLEYVTQSENALHAYRLGLQHGRKGEKHHAAKLTAQAVRAIRSYAKQGCKGKDIASFFDVSKQAVCDVLKGRRWSHVV